jgi:hypothetical protein
VTARRLFMTGVIVSLERGSITQYSAGIFVTLGSALLQTAFAPYCETAENALAFFVEINIFFIIYAAFVACLRPDMFQGGRGRDLGVLLFVVTLGVLAFGVGALLFALFCGASENDRTRHKTELNWKTTAADKDRASAVGMVDNPVSKNNLHLYAKGTKAGKDRASCAHFLGPSRKHQGVGRALVCVAPLMCAFSAMLLVNLR